MIEPAAQRHQLAPIAPHGKCGRGCPTALGRRRKLREGAFVLSALPVLYSYLFTGSVAYELQTNPAAKPGRRWEGTWMNQQQAAH
jgi:hypothetical protein